MRREEEPVQNVFAQAIQCFQSNLIGPINYLKEYEKYAYILNGEAENDMLNFFKVVPFPFLKDFGKKIQLYDELKKELIFLRRSIPLNFISLECGDLNDLLYNTINKIRMYIVNYFITENHNHNRK